MSSGTWIPINKLAFDEKRSATRSFAAGRCLPLPQVLRLRNAVGVAVGLVGLVAGLGPGSLVSLAMAVFVLVHPGFGEVETCFVVFLIAGEAFADVVGAGYRILQIRRSGTDSRAEFLAKRHEVAAGDHAAGLVGDNARRAARAPPAS